MINAEPINATLPYELVVFANSKGCADNQGFYDKPGIYDPPFAFGFDEQYERHNSAIFICQIEFKNKYMLYAVSRKYGRDEFKLHESCPPLELWRSQIGGIRLLNDGKEHFKFSTFDDDQKDAPKEMSLSNPLVEISIGGAGSVFYCYKNKWYYDMFD